MESLIQLALEPTLDEEHLGSVLGPLDLSLVFLSFIYLIRLC